MYSSIVVFALAALTLNAVLALPVNQEDSRKDLKVFSDLDGVLGSVPEFETNSLDQLRERRAADEEVNDSSGEDDKKDESGQAKEDHKDKTVSSESGSSEEGGKQGSSGPRHKRSAEEEEPLNDDHMSHESEDDQGESDELAELLLIHDLNSNEFNNEISKK